jgi:hypothetical protein
MKITTIKNKVKSKLNKSRNKTSSKNLTKKKSSKSTVSRLTGGANFDGKIFGFKVPVLSQALKNKFVQSAVIGAGTVATVGAVVQLVNNDKINQIWNKKEVRAGTALAAGDVISAGTVLALESPDILNKLRGTQTQGNSQGLSSQAGFA